MAHEQTMCLDPVTQEGKTPLQLHVEFFDRNGDGKVYPSETYRGFRALGFGIPFSIFSAVSINGVFSYPTLKSWIPNLLFPIYIENIHKDKHGSDTDVYDKHGRFVPDEFEAIFTKFAKTHPNKMTFQEIMNMTKANRDAYDFFGMIAAQLEWRPAFSIMKDEDGFASKEDIRGIYDGSLFYRIEKRRKGSRGSQKETQKLTNVPQNQA